MSDPLVFRNDHQALDMSVERPTEAFGEEGGFQQPSGGDVAAGRASGGADESATLQAIRDHLEMCTEHTRELGIIVSDVQPQSQALINSKITGIVSELAELDRLKLGPAERLMVPRDVLEFVDAGKNPECYTADAMGKAVKENDHARERIESYRRFKAIMLLELSRLFPKEMQHYKSLHRDWLNS